MSTFYLKYRDVLPILEATLLKPDNTVYDLTGAVSCTLHIRLSNGTTASKTMTIYNIVGGVVRYSWLAADWTHPTTPLIVGTHRMEFEVLGPGGARLTFPNDRYDQLQIVSDVGQA